MVGGKDNMLVTWRKRQAAGGVVVLPQRAGQWHQPIAQNALGYRAALARCGSRYGKARHIGWQGAVGAGIRLATEAVAALPVGVQHMAVAQVGNAGAAQLTQFCKWATVGRSAQHHVDPVARPLQRRAVVRRAQENDGFEFVRPP